jgi:hypothetical protein
MRGDTPPEIEDRKYRDDDRRYRDDDRKHRDEPDRRDETRTSV